MNVKFTDDACVDLLQQGLCLVAFFFYYDGVVACCKLCKGVFALRVGGFGFIGVLNG